MATTFILPVEVSSPLQEFEVPLDGKVFRLRCKFNAREGYWYVDVIDPETGDYLRSGVKLVSEWDVMIPWQGDDRPAGKILVSPQGTVIDDANELDELGDTHLMTYTGET